LIFNGEKNWYAVLTGTLPLDGGKVVVGETIKVGYYKAESTQNQDNALLMSLRIRGIHSVDERKIDFSFAIVRAFLI
jgi:hypothetical protein